MLFCWKFFVESHMVSVPAGDEWHLYCTLDEQGMPVICLETTHNQYLVANGFEYINEHNEGLNAGHVSRFYYEVVNAVYMQFKTHSPSCIDIADVKRAILPEFWGDWIEKGYVDAYSEPFDLVF